MTHSDGSPALDARQVARAQQIAMYLLELARTEQREVISGTLTVLATIAFMESQGDYKRGGDLMESLFRDGYKALRVLYRPVEKTDEDGAGVSG